MTERTRTSAPTPEQRPAHQQRQRRRARGFSVTLGVLVLLSSATQLLSGGYDGAPIAVLAIFVLSVGALVWLLVTRAWRWPRMQARLAQEVLATDRRPPVLYLRPFEADRRRTWYERRIGRALRRLGPVIAVGRPDEALPATPHLSRAYLRQDEWHDRVLDLARGASLVVLHVGTSAGVAWEVEQVTRLGRPERVVLCLGHDAIRRVLPRPRAPRAYPEFRARLGKLFPRGLPADVGASTFIAFDVEWNPIPSRALRDGRPHALTAPLRRLDRRLAGIRVV